MATLPDIQTHSELATALGVSRDQLTSCSYGRGRSYKKFQIKKRKSGRRPIAEPKLELKRLQQQLMGLFAELYHPPASVHGYVRGRSIATNASQHVASNWVLTVDLADFFCSINFGRVCGLLHKRLGISYSVSCILAQMCTFEDKLPQGAPTSPILSNLVMAPLDRRLDRLARHHGCRYTRFADDMTFSSDQQSFPKAIGRYVDGLSPASGAVVGSEIESIISKYGFTVNPKKTALYFKDVRQIVTGLVVNQKVNTPRVFSKRIRAMLYAWKTFGLKAAEKEHFRKYDSKDRAPHSDPTFDQIVKGHIDFFGMIRGHHDSRYKRFVEQYAALDPDYEGKPGNPLNLPAHLISWRDAIWVVEAESCFGSERDDDVSQGTAFFLRDVGLVTCAHVILDSYGDVMKSIEIFHPDWPDLGLSVQVRCKDIGRDLAILELNGSPPTWLEARWSPTATTGEEVWS